ncbi:hypothetical protein [Vibrio mediterranei]|uniref:hypothetical protein n=1 Tax=Vibrio mediterranei TaxID=689 RepID=UPI00148C5B55|nr:hypothetical protein [Vibrio mediterranei]
MPIAILIPLIAGGVGFGAGFWTGSTTTKVVKAAALAGGSYIAYKAIKGAA